MDKYIGRLLDNRYEILEVIGTGGMAVVYKARCHKLNRMVAIKILKDDYLQDEDFRRRFHSESQAVAMLSHPNIVAVYDVSTSIMMDYIVMELIEGISLKQYMEKKGVLNWKETLHFAIQIAKALEHAHSRGIVHRDIKPHNVMVLKNGSVKVTDFGIARMMSKGNTLTKEALGSVHYISPEQAKGGRVDNRSDIYSLGTVMYEMMSGRPPYDGDSPVAVAIQHINGGAIMPSTLNPNIPGGLEQIIMKAMAHEPSQRYETAAAMLRDMDDFRRDPAILFDYNTPPLDDVIKLHRPSVEPQPENTPVTTAERVANRGKVRKRTAPNPNRAAAERRRRQEEEEKRNKIATIAIISCSVVAVLAIAIFLVVFFGSSAGDEPQLVTIPDLVGQYYDKLPEYEDLEIRKDDERFDDQYPQGQIIEQYPAADTTHPKGTKVYITVSLGIKSTQMPELTGKTEMEARNSLMGLQMGLEIHTEEAHHATVPEGSVISSDPAVGETIEKGDKITLTVSLGPEPEMIVMPDVERLTEDEARKRLEDMKLKLDIQVEEENHDTIPTGEVIRTIPALDQEIEEGQEVVLIISKGPIRMENLVKLPLEEALHILETMEIELEIVQETAYDDTIPAGKIISTDPAVGDKLTDGQVVTLTISKGKQSIMPDLKNKTEEEAGDALAKLELDIEVVKQEQFHDTIPAGQVISTNPQANKPVADGDTVTLVISKGKETANIPNLVGLTADQAVNIISKYFEDYEIQPVEKSDQAVGIVVGQSHKGETEVSEKITLYVSPGPQNSTTPTTTPTTSPDTTEPQNISANGFTAGDTDFEKRW